MGKDRQEKKLRESGRVEADRDQALHFDGATKMQSPKEARRLNDGKQSK
ncbi:YpzI family protein [Bacillus sp. B15-48]|nr:YpzI family protein [Bacillus sp. B15-48]MBM4762139.1 YpzI family protein [Bacillus sp. B15-48]